MTNEELALRVAAAVLVFGGLGFGIPAVIGMKSLADGNGVATVMGFPAYGGGGLERAGVESTVLLLGLFLAVCAAEVVAAALVWQGSVAGGWLAVALLVPGAVFWWGFDLPIPWVFAVARTLLLWAGWGALK